ncbi:MAG: NAD(P)-binding domain-containing protein, partial [Anaerolineae bacterium]|nr:NAD(P)-binding domain-containing protein [Anaerolineae bacterium]
ATNTDVAGFMDDLRANGVDPAGMNVVVLGAGGAARAAVYGLAEAGAHIRIINRTPQRAQELIDSLRVQATVAGVNAVAGAELIVNCTSVGLQPKIAESPLPDESPLQPGVIVYDMVYRPAQTKLMTQVEAAGGRAIGGLGMLVRQGAAAFNIWTGVQPPVDVMRSAAEREMGQ